MSSGQKTIRLSTLREHGKHFVLTTIRQAAQLATRYAEGGRCAKGHEKARWRVRSHAPLEERRWGQKQKSELAAVKPRLRCALDGRR
jgi:hypothetical protein